MEVFEKTNFKESPGALLLAWRQLWNFIVVELKFNFLLNVKMFARWNSLFTFCSFCLFQVPLQGFAALEGMNGAQKFQIHRDDRSTDRLPSAHTCFNQLDLPAYETYDKLKTYLMKAIQECSEGFGFA